MGEQGYWRLLRGKGGSGECGILQQAVYPVVKGAPGPSPGPPPPPPGPSGGVFNIKFSGNQGMCLDLPGGDTKNGNKIWLWQCNGMNSQKWRFDTGSYKITYAADPSKCVDIPGSSYKSGNPLQLWDCNGQSGQYWGYDSTKQTIYASNSEVNANFCMDLYGGTPQNGATIDIWSCLNGEKNQQWVIAGAGPSPGPPPPAPPAPGPPAPSPPSPPTGGHYGMPPCNSDEQNIDMGNTQICAASCDSNPCPTDVPAGTSAQPTCSDSSQANDRICFLICSQDSECPSGASCANGVCGYPKTVMV